VGHPPTRPEKKMQKESPKRIRKRPHIGPGNDRSDPPSHQIGKNDVIPQNLSARKKPARKKKVIEETLQNISKKPHKAEGK